MPTVQEEDMLEQIPIPIKALIPAVPRDDKELQQLVGDLRIMGARVCSPNPGTSYPKRFSGNLSLNRGISGSARRRGIRIRGRRTCGIGSTDFRGASRRGRQVAMTPSTPVSSAAIRIRRVSTLVTAVASGSGGY